jgi:hypothetical protein
VGAVSLAGLFFRALVGGDRCVSWCCHGGIFEAGVKEMDFGAWDWKVKVVLRMFMVDALVPWLKLHLSVTAERGPPGP